MAATASAGRVLASESIPLCGPVLRAQVRRYRSHGTLGDGAAGLSQFGGIKVVQDPSDAAFSEMPTTALMRSQPNHIVGLADMPALFEKLVRQPAGQPMPVTGAIEYEVNVASGGRTNMSEMDRIGRLAPTHRRLKGGPVQPSLGTCVSR